MYKDKSFRTIIKKPTVSYYLKKTCNLTKGSSESGRGSSIAEVTKSQCEAIAKEKIEEMNTTSLDAAIKMVEGSARSMGIKVI